MKYTKGKPTQLSTNFKSTEFDCHGQGCCSTTEVDPKLVEFLQVIRDHFGKSVHISSGYRCPVHNKNVGGATGSRHGKGQAADIFIDGVKPKEIAQYAENMGIKGIGLYETSKDGFFVHVDTRTSKSFWYGQAQAKKTTFQDANSAPTVQIDTSVADPKKPTQNTQAEQKNELPTLRRGDKNEVVRELQTKLIELGFTIKRVDGIFGANTEAALRAFQKERNLVPDGICGAKTWAEIYAFAPYNVLVNVNMLNVRIGPSTGTAIKGQVRKGEKATVIWQVSNWGKLKDGAGWICLDYVKKI